MIIDVGEGDDIIVIAGNFAGSSSHRTVNVGDPTSGTTVKIKNVKVAKFEDATLDTAELNNLVDPAVSCKLSKRRSAFFRALSRLASLAPSPIGMSPTRKDLRHPAGALLKHSRTT